MNWQGKSVVIVGAGASGLSAAALLRRLGASVALNDKRSEAELGEIAEKARALGVELRLGSHDASRFAGADAIVVSPGVPALPELAVLESRGLPILAEVELVAPFVRGTLIGITGTNGKSTVTTLVGRMCEATGRPTFTGGNLGTALTEVVGTEAAEHGYVVAELSSFQLERVRELRCHVGVLLNVTPDHLDRHGSVEAYAQAKARVFAAQTEDDHAVVPAGDALCERLTAEHRGRVHRFGAGGEVRVEGGAIVDSVSGLRFPLSKLRIVGRHNQDNACASILAARLAGVAPDVIARALEAFGGLPHRAVLVRELDGVQYVDDSKATNVGATVAALDGLASPERRVVLIAGGVDKGGSYQPIAERMRAMGRALVLIGQARELIRAALAPVGLPIRDASSMHEAVSIARSLAQRGDLVLLAPACASFDMFKSYAHRGDVFAGAVRALEENE